MPSLTVCALGTFGPRLVSASDLRKYDHVPALQDNVELLTLELAAHSPLLRTLGNTSPVASVEVAVADRLLSLTGCCQHV